MMGRTPGGAALATTPAAPVPRVPGGSLRSGADGPRCVCSSGTLAPGAGPGTAGSSAVVRLSSLAAGAAVGLLVLGGCDAGQEAETAQETPDVAGVNGTVGEVSLDDVFIEADGTIEAGGSAPLRAVLTNDAQQDDDLLRVTTPAAASVQLLAELGVPSPDGIALPAGGQVDGTTGNIRMQLEGVTEPIETTDTVPVTFTFEHAGEVRLDVPVAPGADVD
jgi:copper(I)-binding protein